MTNYAQLVRPHEEFTRTKDIMAAENGENAHEAEGENKIEGEAGEDPSHTEGFPRTRTRRAREKTPPW